VTRLETGEKKILREMTFFRRKYNSMKRKISPIWRIAIALVLALGLSLIPALPAGAADLTDVTATPDVNVAGATANYTIAFTANTTGTIAVITMEFPTGFDVTDVSLINKTGIGDGTIEDQGQAVVYNVTVPAEVTEGTPITIELGNIVNTQTAGTDYAVTVTTYAAGPTEIDGPTNSAPFEIVAGEADHFVVETENSGTEIAGEPFTVTITAYDQYNNIATSYTGVKEISFDCDATPSPNDTEPTILASENVTFTDGIGTTTGTFTLVDAGETPTITAGDGEVEGTSDPIILTPSAVASYTVEPEDAKGGEAGIQQIAGTEFDVTITAFDAYGNPMGDAYNDDAPYVWETNASVAPDGTAPVIGALTSDNFSDGVAVMPVTLAAVEAGVTFTVGSASTGNATSAAVFVEGINLDSQGYRSGSTVKVWVGDQSKNANPSVAETSSARAMSDTTDPDKILFALTETSPNSGIFYGTFQVVNTTPGTGQLLVSHGDTIRIYYPIDGTLEVSPLNQAKVDDAPPAITNLTPSDNSTITENKPIISATLTDPDSGINENTIVMTLDDEEVDADYDSGSLTYTPSDSLTDSLHTVTVSVSDYAGNVAEESWSFTVDTTAPAITDFYPEDGSYVSDNLTYISAAITGADIDWDTLVMKVNGEDVTENVVTDNETGVVTYTPEEEFEDGLVEVTIDVDDLQGNSAETAEWSFTVDATTPVITIDAVTTPTNVDTQAISGTYTEVNLDTIVLTINDVEVEITFAAGVWETTDNATLSEGNNLIVVTITDLAGNTASDNATILLDITPPVIADTGTDPAFVEAGVSTNVTFFATVTDGLSDVDTVTIDLSQLGEDYEEMTEEEMTYNEETERYEYLLEGLELESAAPITLTITATDALSNSTEEALILNPDDEDPVITNPAIEYPFGLSSAMPGDNVTITVTVTDNLAVDSVTVSCSAFAETVTLSLVEDDIYSGEATVKGDAPKGSYTVTITATDAAENSKTDESLACAVDPAVTGYNLELVEGWNLISLPIIPGNPNMTVIISANNLASRNVSSVGIIRAYDPETGEFPYYMPEAEEGEQGELTEMHDGYGFWVFMNEDDILTVIGRQWPAPPAVMPSYYVTPGWNLIGFKSLEEDDDTHYLASLNYSPFFDPYPVLWSYDAVAGKYENVKGVAKGMQVGHGFWIWLLEPSFIVPPQ
jgi:hypothetical protein